MEDIDIANEVRRAHLILSQARMDGPDSPTAAAMLLGVKGELAIRARQYGINAQPALAWIEHAYEAAMEGAPGKILGWPEADAVLTEMLAAHYAAGEKQHATTQNNLTEPSSDPLPLDAFPNGEFVDPASKKRISFKGKRLLWELMKTLCEARQNLAFTDLMTIVSTWKDKIVTDDAVSGALKNLRKLLRDNGLNSIADQISSDQRIVSPIKIK